MKKVTRDWWVIVADRYGILWIPEGMYQNKETAERIGKERFAKDTSTFAGVEKVVVDVTKYQR